MLIVSFIGIDPTFPHHLNSFDNVPVNYNNGALSGITVKDSVTRYYYNTVNYTQQVGGSSPYNKFLSPLSRNKILLFITTMHITGSLELFPNSGPYNAL